MKINFSLYFNTVLFILSFFVFLSSVGTVNAQLLCNDPDYPKTCTPDCPCSDPGNTAWCNQSTGECVSTCGQCSCEQCGGTYPFPACQGSVRPACIRTAYCTCNSSIYQINTDCCVTPAPTRPPGVTATPSPTATPVPPTPTRPPGVTATPVPPTPTRPPGVTATPRPSATSTPRPTATPVPCRVTTSPSSINLVVGGATGTVSAVVSSGLGSATITRMDFGVYDQPPGSNIYFASVNPTFDLTSSYQTTVRPLLPGSTAVWATATLSDGRRCQSTSSTDTNLNVTNASCTIALPSSGYTIFAGASTLISPTYPSAPVGGTISNVRFTVANTTIATVCSSGNTSCAAGLGPYTDSATVFDARLTGQTPGSTSVTARATMNTGSTCTSASVPVNIANVPGWWQVISGDIISGNTAGSIISTIPVTCILSACTPVLIKNNPQGFSGVASTGTSGSGSVNVGTGSVSSPSNWRAVGAGFLSAEGYNYTYFKRKIPSNVTPVVISGTTVANTTLQDCIADSSGYCWFTYNNGSSLSISGGAVSLGTRKVILFVEGANFNLNQKVSFTKGLGAFYVFSERNISIATSVGDTPVASPTPDIEGVLFAGGQVVIPTNGTSNDLQLYIRGAVVGLGTNGSSDGIDANRTLSNNGLYPAEIFEFGPDLILNWPKSLTRRTLQWREVAP